jgi:FkbM family methyltransferase
MDTLNVGILTRAARLGFAGLVTAAVCFSYYLFTMRGELYWIYRCIKQATHISSCYRGDGAFDFTADLFGMRYEGNTGNYIDERIFFAGAYEKPILFLMRDIMKSAFNNQGVFVDVGANTGQHSLFMSRYSGEVHAFEPYEPVLKRFRRMVEINHIRNTVIHPVGLGESNANVPFYKPPDRNLATGSFVEGFKPGNTYLGQLEIQVGDEVLQKSGVLSVAVVKIDIEGYEKFALRGLRKTLLNSRPFVVFELTTDPQSPVSIKNKTELYGLFPENYEFLVIEDHQGLVTGEYQFADVVDHVHFNKLEQNDVLAYPVEKKKFLALGPTRK